MDANRDSLGQADPSEDGIDGSNPLTVGLRVRDVDCAGDAVDVTADDLTMAHQLDLSRIAHPDGSKVRFLKISVDPKRIGVDKGNGVHADIDVVAKLRQQVGHIAVNRRKNARALEVYPRLV